MIQRWLGLLSLLMTTSSAQWSFRPSRQDTTGCATPNDEAGQCVNIRKCSILLDLLRNQRNKPGVTDFLRQSVCGYEGSDPKVCCPLGRQGVGSTPPPPKGPLPDPPVCGKPLSNDHTRIIGGQPAELGAWPWLAALGYRSNSKPGPLWLCGGALITDRYILTAAHCTRTPRFTLYLARLGDLNLNDSVADQATPLDLRIEKMIPHKEYSSTKYTNDIALLRLERMVQFTDLIRPICLPKASELRSNNFVKNYPFVAGWGSTSFRGPSSTELMEVQIPVVENEGCKEVYKSKGADIGPNQLCAGYAKGGKDACQGDSGGPLMWPQGTIYYQIGVVSFGFRCAEPGFPGIYSRVTNYVDWVIDNIQP